jgi:uncharacterized protein (TIGR02466 family)
MTEETKVETTEEKELESFENPFIIEPFATPPILVFKYSDDVEDLKKRALQVPFSDLEAGLVQSEESKVLHNIPEFKELKEFIDKCIKHYLIKVCGSQHEVQITQSWVNILKKWSGHPSHIHANSYLSGVFYLDVDPENGNPIEFERLDEYFSLKLGDEGHDDPRKHYKHIYPNIKVTAMNGHLLLFPSTLRHRVGINELEDPRISLSFNTFPKRPFGYANVYGGVE